MALYALAWLRIIAALILFQALTDMGGHGSNGCAVPTQKDDSDKIEDVTVEKIKTKVK